MALTEKLAILISADARGAVQAFEQAGDAADKNLSKADTGAARFGDSLTKVGAGMVGFAAVVGVGLFSAAKAAEEANRSSLLLDNTLQNMPALAGANRQAFVDLADAIQNKTAADGDQIVAAQAMLGTFSTTQDEILGLTPLVVDYARKFGVDLTDAALAVGKAMDGQVGALKRNGVSIDENIYKTDRYKAVTEALRDQVGGFAEQEGKTLSGRLERLKNELGDVQEGIGVGVVSAVESALGPVTDLADKFSGLSEQTQSNIGKTAAYGTATIGAVGGVSLLTGQLIKLRDRFSAVDETGNRFLTTSGKMAAGFGIAGGIVTAAVALDTLHESITGLKVDMEELALMSEGELVESFNKVGDAVAYTTYGNMEGARQWAAFNQVLDENIGKADEIARVLEQRGIPGWEKARDAVNSKRDATVALNESEQRGTEIIGEATGATEEQTEATRELTTHTTRAKEALDAYKTAQDSVFGASLSLAEQQIRNRQAVDELRVAVDAGKTADETAQQAKDRLTLQTISLIEGLDGEVQKMVEAGEITDTATGRHDALLWKLVDLQNKFPELREEIQGHIDKLQKVPTDVTTAMQIHWDDARRALGEYRAELDKIPLTKETRLIVTEERHDSFRFENQASLNQQARAR